GWLTGSERSEQRYAWSKLGPVIDFLVAMRTLVRQRRANSSDDLISTILAAQEGETALTDREVIQFVSLLLVAGNETTTHLIGNLNDAILVTPAKLRSVASTARRVTDAIE